MQNTSVCTRPESVSQTLWDREEGGGVLPVGREGSVGHERLGLFDNDRGWVTEVRLNKTPWTCYWWADKL